MKLENQVFIQGHTSLKFAILGAKSWPYDFFSVFLCRHLNFEWGSSHSTTIKWGLIKSARGEIAGKWGRRGMSDYSTASEIFGLPSRNTGKFTVVPFITVMLKSVVGSHLGLSFIFTRYLEKKSILLITVLWDGLSQTNANSNFWRVGLSCPMSPIYVSLKSNELIAGQFINSKMFFKPKRELMVIYLPLQFGSWNFN